MHAPPEKSVTDEADQRPQPLPGWQGKPAEYRRVGIELEFAGLPRSEAAETIREVVGGSIRVEHPDSILLEETALGLFVIESQGLPVPQQADAGEWGPASGGPMRLIAPPVAVSRLPRIAAVVRRLTGAGATGAQGLRNAFGLRIDVEAPALDVEIIVAVTQAFLLVSPWLRVCVRPDAAPKVLPFTAPFPPEYRDHVLRTDYRPSLPSFILHYCAANPTGRCELELLPLLASIDAATVGKGLGCAPPAPRPAFHYRRGGARIGDPRWSLITEWNRWVLVERLAIDDARRHRMIAEWNAFRTDGAPLHAWIDYVEEQLSP